MPRPEEFLCDFEDFMEMKEVEGQEAKCPRQVGKRSVSEPEEEWAMANRHKRVGKVWDLEEEREDSADEDEEEDGEDEDEKYLRIKRPRFPLSCMKEGRCFSGGDHITHWIYRRNDPFRNPGEPINYGKTTSKFDPAKKKLHKFVRSAERALDQWNETHEEGDDLELVEVVSGYRTRFDLRGHFNFKAKPKGSQDDKDVRFFFAEVQAALARMSPNVGAWITTCLELKQGSMINCCLCCRPIHGVYHPCELVQLNYDELSEHHRLSSRFYCPNDPNEYYEKCPVKIA